MFYYILCLFIFIIVLLYSLDINECLLSIAIKINSIEIVKFLVEHGADVNMKLIHFLFISIIIWWYSLSFHIFNCFIKFSVFSYLLLFYYIVFLSIFFIVLYNCLFFYVYHYYMLFPFFPYLLLFYRTIFYFIFIIVLLYFHSFYIYYCYAIFFLFIFITALWDSLDINVCPLSIAIYNNSIEIVKFLVEHGADVKAPVPPSQF